MSRVMLGVRGCPKYVYVALRKYFTAVSRLLGGIVEGTFVVSFYLKDHSTDKKKDKKKISTRPRGAKNVAKSK